ncbi:MAG: helix-turn-helix domain-containing protein [Deltaproteobacteria bacterium]|nr:helix-turn-helix domain-containing protein [Deltaproteobacteria bacterium]
MSGASVLLTRPTWWYYTTMQKPASFTISEAARQLGITRASVFEAIKSGRLEAEWGEAVQVIKRRAWKIPADVLEKYSVSLAHQRAGKKTV